MSRWIFGLLTIGWCCAPTDVHAQRLILKLPADGTWVRYEGTYAQTEVRPDTATGQLEIPPWVEHVTLKSVGSQMADFQGQSVACRWLEIKVERGREADGKIDTGITGLEVYKILVPEAAIIPEAVDADGIPVGYVPFVKGYRKVGSGEPKPLTEPALKLYPLAVLLSYARAWEVAEKGVDPGAGLGNVSADLLTGAVTQERPSSRTVLSAKAWVSTDVPFGVAAWSATIVRSQKDDRKLPEDFKEASRIIVEQKARETGQDAKSDLMVE